MRIFIDSARLADIEAALQRGFVGGVTTNPSIMARDPESGGVADIIGLMQRYGMALPLSVEVTESDPSEMLRQALQLYEAHSTYPELIIKIPIGWDELQVVARLRRDDINVNVTACMSYNQAMMAANAGANYVSLFWGRIRDTGQDAATVVRQVSETFELWECPTEIIVGSIRQMIDVNEAMQSGADIVTVPAHLLPLLCKHPKTDEAVNQFLRDAQSAVATSAREVTTTG